MREKQIEMVWAEHLLTYTYQQITRFLPQLYVCLLPQYVKKRWLHPSYFCLMRQILFITAGILMGICGLSQYPVTFFEKSGGEECSSYHETISFFAELAKLSPMVHLIEKGTTDAGYPLHVVLISSDGNFDPEEWHRQGHVVIMINNSIHPGEPDGTDASQLLVRDFANGKLALPNGIRLAVIPVYNIGGALNRGRYSRVNQNGPKEYGFRGNAQNLDLNRDFTKLDSRNAASFHTVFQWLDPHILIDNHVSDGADFRHTMTLLTTQYDKLGEHLGRFLRDSFEPDVYQVMKTKGWDMFPYVNFSAYDLGRGMTQFYDPPRYSSGYAALFQCIGFVPETHMLKPFKERVKSTYDLMVTIAVTASNRADSLKLMKTIARQAVAKQLQFPLEWKVDTSRFMHLTFKGYERDTTLSEVTGLPRMYYRRDKPFDANIKFYCYFKPDQFIAKPKAYIIPQGWHKVHEKLALNKVPMRRFDHDTLMEATVYRVESFTTTPRPYENHFRHSKVKTTTYTEKVLMLKGDYLVEMGHYTDRFVVEMLEPTGADSYFSWNFFDAILQQKEGYSSYRWEEVAADWLKKNPDLRKKLEEKKATDPDFAKNAQEILNWVYRNSPYFEPAFNRYPVYRIIK